MTEATTASSPNPPPPRIGRIAHGAALLARIGADARDDAELRQKKALLVLLAILILPVSVVWGSLYLGFGSPVGVVPYVYFAVSLGSLLMFARTKRFRPLLVTQLLAILLTTTVGQMLIGGFVASGGVGLWGILAPLGALVFLEEREAVRWFVAFLMVFVLTGVAGEVFLLGRGSPCFVHDHDARVERRRCCLHRLHPPRFVRPPAQRGADGTRAEQEKSEALLLNILPRPIAERLKVATQTIADDFAAVSILFADVVEFTVLAQRLPPAQMVGILDQLFSDFDVLVERHGLEKIKTIGDCYMAAAGVPSPCSDHARRAALLALEMRGCARHVGGGRSARSRAEDRHQLWASRRRGDRDETLSLRPVGRRREHGESDGVPWHTRRDPDHRRDVRTVGG